ncbi:Regulator of microtubule dynamics protein 1, partial [Operophtera brumata]
QPSQKLKSVFAVVASYAFLWPLKKPQQLTNEKTVDELQALINYADDLFENGHYEDSYEILSTFHDQENMEIQWRLVRALYNMSKDTKYERNHRKKFVYQAYEIVTKLITCHAQHNVVQKWYALILDTKSSYEGIKERIQQLENLAVTLNPDDATSLHMLGEWCYQITEMPWHQRKIAEVLFASPPRSTYEDALEYFLKAEAAEPRFYSMNLLRIGNCYLKMERDDQAKYYLKLAA